MPLKYQLQRAGVVVTRQAQPRVTLVPTPHCVQAECTPISQGGVPVVPNVGSQPGLCTCPDRSAQPPESLGTGQGDCLGRHGADTTSSSNLCRLRLSTHLSHRLSISSAHKVTASPGRRLNLSNSRLLSPYKGRGSTGNEGVLMTLRCAGSAAGVAWRTMGATWLGMAHMP